MGSKRIGARWLGTLIVAAAVMTGCSDPSTSPSIASKLSSQPSLALGDVNGVTNQIVIGQLKICKLGNTSGTFTVTHVSGTGTFLASPTVVNGTCQIVGLSANPTGDLWDVSENAAPANTVQAFNGALQGIGPSGHLETNTQAHGDVLTYTNTFTAPPPPPPLVALFVIGNDEPHGMGDVVNFWGAQWWKNNSMTGFVSNGVASFKGYATSSSPCTWVSLPGNSSNPPATIPAIVRVIVTSTVLKQGNKISGDIVGYVDVQHDGNYQDNPGHAGSGPIVATSTCTPP